MILSSMSTAIAAIIPAYNEESTIASVIRALQATSEIDEIIVVDDGSSDATSDVARACGVTVITQKNGGKGQAMQTGAASTQAPILFFSDADLEGLTPAHIRSILKDVISGYSVMSVGVLDRGWMATALHLRFGRILGGERAIRREVFMALSGKGVGDFGIETVMNKYCARHHLPVSYVLISGVRHIIKEQKYGPVRGFLARMKMIRQVVRAEMPSKKL